MSMDEATKFWEFFETMPEKVQLNYMNDRFGELAFDISKDWEDYKIEYDSLKKLKEDYEKNIEKIEHKSEDVFVENVFELAFGDNAINKEYTKQEVLKRLREFSDLALKQKDIIECLEACEGAELERTLREITGVE